MGSGASKVNSHHLDVAIPNQISSEGLSPEQNNNFTVNKLSAVSVVNENETTCQKSQIKTTDNQLSNLTKTQEEVPFKVKTTKSSSPKTEVISLKPTIAVIDNNGKEKPSAVIKQLSEELTASESQRLDLLDQIQLLKEKCASREQQLNVKPHNIDALQETINAKDQYIVTLEKEAKTNQAEANKMRIKLKKRIKSLSHQLLEVRQEASISQMELKAEIVKLAEQIKNLKAGQAVPSSCSGEERSANQDQHSKIIVELSSQLSEQSEQIASLENELSEKKKEISSLKLAITSHYDTEDTPADQSCNNPNSSLPKTSTDRLPSSRGKRVTINNNTSQESPLQNYNVLNSSPAPFVDKTLRNSPKQLERQSTALSDSDSDWGDGSPAPSHTHSAPARSRVKSAISLASSGKHKGSLTTLNGDDDTIMDLMNSSPTDTKEHRLDSNKKSSYRHHLERMRQGNQSSSLIGPTLAFERQAEPFSDTSCEPTPRTQRLLPTKTNIRIVKPIVH